MINVNCKHQSIKTAVFSLPLLFLLAEYNTCIVRISCFIFVHNVKSYFILFQADRLPCVTGIVVPEGIFWKDVTDFAMQK